MWEEIAKTVNYIHNKSPTKALKLKTPEEAFSGIRPNLSHLRVIGCVAFWYIPSEKRNKLEPKAIPTILVGYDENNKAYRCYDPKTRRIIISRDVRFNKRSCNPGVAETIDPLLDELPPYVSELTNYKNEAPIETNISLKTQLSNEEIIFPEEGSNIEEEILPPPLPLPLEPTPATHTPIIRRSHRLKKQSVKLEGYHVYVSTDNFDECIMATEPEDDENLLHQLILEEEIQKQTQMTLPLMKHARILAGGKKS